MRIIANGDRTAVINQQTGDTGLISGRKTFQGIFGEGVKVFHAISGCLLVPRCDHSPVQEFGF